MKSTSTNGVWETAGVWGTATLYNFAGPAGAGLPVYPALTTRNGGEVISDDQY